MNDKLENMLIRHEGLKLKPYRCTAGKLTIGIGRNLDDNGITEAEARMMCRYDVEVVRTPLLKYKWFTLLNEARQDAILDMAFNLGLPRFLKFKNMLQALQDQDYHKAAEEMMTSQWAQQVGERATELAAMMVEGRYLNR
jgi:lysozyme